jgi:hypothetical protein
LPDQLREALEIASHDELAGHARMHRIKSKLAAAISRDNEEQAQVPSPRISGWRPAAPQRHIRFAAAKVGLAALVGMGAAWSSVQGYRIYEQFVERAVVEEPPPMQTVKSRPGGAAPVAAPSLRASPGPDPSPSIVVEADPVVAMPPVGARSESSSFIISTKPRFVPRPALAVQPPNVPTAPPPPVEEDLLERAVQALRRDPTEALTLADEHARIFAGGRLAQEREVVAIQALSKLARPDAAGARAKRFLQLYSNSPYANDVARLANPAAVR